MEVIKFRVIIALLVLVTYSSCYVVTLKRAVRSMLLSSGLRCYMLIHKLVK